MASFIQTPTVWIQPLRSICMQHTAETYEGGGKSLRIAFTSADTVVFCNKNLTFGPLRLTFCEALAVPAFSHRPKVGSVQMEKNGSCVFYFKLAMSDGCICNLEALDWKKSKGKLSKDGSREHNVHTELWGERSDSVHLIIMPRSQLSSYPPFITEKGKYETDGPLFLSYGPLFLLSLSLKYACFLSLMHTYVSLPTHTWLDAHGPPLLLAWPSLWLFWLDPPHNTHSLW